MEQNGIVHDKEDSKQCILLLAPLKKGCGNNTTAARLKHYFETHGIQCKLCGTSEFSDKLEFTSHITRENITGVIALHALHSGKWLTYLNPNDIPYTVIFGGTDLNEYSKNPEQLAVMTQVVNNASYLVCFSQQMSQKALSIWPGLDANTLLEIPQAPKSRPSRVSLSEGLREKYDLEDDSVIFTLVAGIRPVKDPMYILKAFSDWHVNVNPKCYLLIAGPVLDQSYHERFQKQVSECPGVIYLGVLLEGVTHTLMRDSFAVVNSSLSEGMCVAILESMEIGVPVIARNIPGNQSVIEHGTTGLLYDSPQELIDCATRLLADSDLYSALCRNGQNYVRANHNTTKECNAYISLVKNLHKEAATSHNHRTLKTINNNVT